MPRVNRDLQRRMAARRERERRRPVERRYSFGTPEREIESEEALAEEEAETTEAVQAPSRPARVSATASPAAQSNRAGARTTRTFSDYKEEYAYVYSDLQRVGVVIGSLLVILIVLYFVLPLLVH